MTITFSILDFMCIFFRVIASVDAMRKGIKER